MCYKVLIVVWHRIPNNGKSELSETFFSDGNTNVPLIFKQPSAFRENRVTKTEGSRDLVHMLCIKVVPHRPDFARGLLVDVHSP